MAAGRTRESRSTANHSGAPAMHDTADQPEKGEANQRRAMTLVDRLLAVIRSVRRLIRAELITAF